MMDPKRHNTYWGIDFIFTKRLSNKWMLNGSATYQDQRNYFGDYGYTDPSMLWANESQIYAFDMGGGSGKISRPFFTRWMFKLMGLYQLPFDINIAGTLSGHEGYYYQTYFNLRDYTYGNENSYSNSMATTKYNDREKLGNVWLLNLKLEKMFKLGDVGRMYLSADVFNVINSTVILRKRDTSYGTYYYEGTPTLTDYSDPPGTSGVNNELMNPIIMRIGLRFQF
jgi:hypothetical protein